MQAIRVTTALLLLLLAAGAATAQNSAPTVSISLAGFPAEPMVLRDNATESFTLKVTVEASNFICTGEGVIPVDLAVVSDLGGVDNVTVSPNPAPFQVPPGVHGGDNPYNATQDVQVTFTVEGAVPANHSHDVQVTAAFAGGSVANCHGTGNFPGAEAQGTFTADMVATPPPVTTVDTDADEEGNGIPAPGLPLALAAAGLAARRLRRR